MDGDGGKAHFRSLQESFLSANHQEIGFVIKRANQISERIQKIKNFGCIAA